MLHSDLGYVSGKSRRVLHAAMMINPVLFAFNFSLLFFIQRERSWKQSLSWFKERQASGVINEM